VKLDSHISCSWEFMKAWKNELTQSQVGFHFESWILMDFRIFRRQWQGSKLIWLKNSLYYWKALTSQVGCCLHEPWKTFWTCNEIYQKVWGCINNLLKTHHLMKFHQKKKTLNGSTSIKSQKKKKKKKWNSNYTKFCDNLSFIPYLYITYIINY